MFQGKSWEMYPGSFNIADISNISMPTWNVFLVTRYVTYVQSSASYTMK